VSSASQIAHCGHQETDSVDYGDYIEYPVEFAFHQRQDIVTSRDLSVCMKNIVVMGENFKYP
jgi:Tfp pilus assembly ATPase PilU